MLNHLVPRTVTVALVAAAVVVAPATAAQAAACPFTGPHTFHWTGGNGHWYQTSHWQEGSVPGKNNSTAHTDYACINNGATVSLVNAPARGRGRPRCHLCRQRVARDHRSRPFPVPQRHIAAVHRAPGECHHRRLGKPRRHGNPRRLRHCSCRFAQRGNSPRDPKVRRVQHTVPARPPARWRSSTARRLTVTGPTNLTDRYVIDNSGTIRLVGNGYIAADWGTSVIRPRPPQHRERSRALRGFHQSETGISLVGQLRRAGQDRRHGTSVIGLKYIRKAAVLSKCTLARSSSVARRCRPPPSDRDGPTAPAPARPIHRVVNRRPTPHTSRRRPSRCRPLRRPLRRSRSRRRQRLARSPTPSANRSR